MQKKVVTTLLNHDAFGHGRWISEEPAMAQHGITEMPDDEVARIIREDCTDEFRRNFILFGEQQTCLTEEYLKYAEAVNNFEIQDDDVIVASFPKTGTTWTQEMVWLVVNDLDYKGAEKKITERFPYLEACTLNDWEKMYSILQIKSPDFLKGSLDFIKKQHNPRCIKTHLPFYLLPKEITSGRKSPKMIYVTRDPKDTCVSYYHHSLLLQRMKPNLEDYVKVFLADRALYAPFWKHVLGYWERRNLPNLLFIKYEDMKHDLSSVVRKVATFLGKRLTDQQIKKLVAHLSFESMKKNQAVNGEELVEIRRELNVIRKEGEFMRSGTVGKYKEELSDEMIEAFDLWTKKNIAGTDFGEEYNYDL